MPFEFGWGLKKGSCCRMKAIFVSVIISLSIISAGYWLHLHDRNDHRELVTDVTGKIEVVVCSVNSARKSTLRNTDLINNIVNGLPEGTHVLLLVNDRKSFASHGNSQNVTMIEMPDESDMSIWPQDPFLVLNGDDGPELLVPSRFDREDDRQMAGVLSEALQLKTTKTELAFEGGNIICGEEVVFIGNDTIVENAQELGLSRHQVIQRFEGLLGREILVVGKGKQKIGHIDMILTPLPNKMVMVADSRLGAEKATEILRDSPEKVERFEHQCEDSFFGRADVVSLVDKTGATIARPQLAGGTAHAIAGSLAIAPNLDQIAEQIAKEGYRVVRVPAVLPPANALGVSTARNDKREPSRTQTDQTNPMQPADVSSDADSVPNSFPYPFMTYSNVLLEVDQGSRLVYLPQYGLEKLDRYAVSVWQSLGFEVIPIAGFSTSAMYGGAMRCCTKVLQRRQSLTQP